MTVNGGPNFLFLNPPSVTVHALAGDEKVVVHAPAPDLADRNVAVAVDGGPPSAGGDQLVVETPGGNQAAYTPSAGNGGHPVVRDGAALVAGVTTAEIEQLTDDGRSGGDSLKVMGTAGADTFTLTPGAANDAGTPATDGALAVAFQNLGAAGRVAVGGVAGADALVYNGTAANDSPHRQRRRRRRAGRPQFAGEPVHRQRGHGDAGGPGGRRHLHPGAGHLRRPLCRAQLPRRGSTSG